MLPNASVAKVTILTASQAQYLQPVSPKLLSDHPTKGINGLIADSEHTVYPSEDEVWFATPEDCSNPETFTGIQKRKYNEVVSLKNLKNLTLLKIPLTERSFCHNFLGKTLFSTRNIRKQAGNGPSRRHIQSSKIAKGLQPSIKYSLLKYPLEEKIEKNRFQFFLVR